MVKKSKKLLLVMLTSFTAVAALTAVLVFGHNEQSIRGIADGEPYSVNLNRSLSSSELANGQASFNTHNNSSIVFKFDSSKSSVTSSELVTLATGGYFYNETRLTGITKIEGSASGGSAKIYFGNDASLLNEGSVSLDTSSSSFTINLENPVDFFRISDVSGSVSINSLKVAFDCSNTYSYLEDREVASNDLFHTSSLEQSFSSAYTLDRKCLDVTNSDSGYSFHLTISSAASGWPTWNFNMGSPVGATSYTIEFYAKGIGHSSYNFMLLDASNANILNGNRAVEVTDSWQKITLSNLTVASGKSLANAQKIKFSANYGSSAGSVRHLYLDQLNLLIPETPTRYNLEMVEYTRASTTQTAAASVDFAEKCGTSSTASRKLDYTTATGFGGSASSTYRAFATFNIEASLGANNGIDAKNCTLSFDIKFSDTFLSSPDSRVGTPTLDVTDSAGTSATLWNISFTVKSGWIHFSKNLSGSLTSLNGNTKTLRFGFYGVYTGNLSQAQIYIDNLALTAN